MTPKGQLQLIADEGRRNKVYDDKTGEPVVKLPSGGNPTIAVGRDLVSRGLTDAEIDYLFSNDVSAFEADLVRLMPWLNDFIKQGNTSTQVRGDVVTMVEFNTGNVFAFRNMLSALRVDNYSEAAKQLLDSEAARAAPERYNRMAEALKTGEWK